MIGNIRSSVSSAFSNLLNEYGTANVAVSVSNIPQMARGGIFDTPTVVQVGEDGTEAIVPLENNTEWMDTLADKIRAGAQRIVIPIYLNGRKIAEEIIDLTKQRNFATNGAI